MHTLSLPHGDRKTISEWSSAYDGDTNISNEIPLSKIWGGDNVRISYISLSRGDRKIISERSSAHDDNITNLKKMIETYLVFTWNNIILYLEKLLVKKLLHENWKPE